MKKNYLECTEQERRELYPRICKLRDFVNEKPERITAFRVLATMSNDNSQRQDRGEFD